MVHLLQVDDDLIEDWDGAANETGVATLGNHSEHVFVAVFQDFADFFGGAGLEHEFGVATELAHPVTIVSLYVFRCIFGYAIYYGGFRAKKVLEKLYMLFSDFCELAVSLKLWVTIRC